MAQQTIGLGSAANDGTGDTLRGAGTKINANFTELYAADALLAPLASPALTGNPTAPTQSPGNNSTRIATTAFVKAALDALVAAAPGALDTLDELAAALGDDANFAATMTAALAGKASATSGTWTPGLQFGGASVGMTFVGGSTGGTWKRVGDLIFAFGHFKLSAKGSSTGTARLTGLPVAGVNYDGSGILNYYAGMASLTGMPMIESQVGGTFCTLTQPGAAAASNLTDANFTNSSEWYFTIIYHV